jgi:two-component system phosphate regulon sensor histidine kinase PhoR
MPLVAFFLGLMIGLGLCLGHRLWFNRRLRWMLAMLPADDSGEDVPVVIRLRRRISQANQSRQQLEASLRIWQQLLQVAPIGYLQVDEENQLLWCNTQARQLLSIQHSALEQAPLLLKVVRSYELDQLVEQTRQTQQPQACEWVFHPAMSDAEEIGRQQTMTLKGYGYPLPGGTVGVFLENRQDVVTLTQSRYRWVTDLAHELRTPLTSIGLVAETLQTMLEPPARHWVDRLLKETQRLSKLVQDWLDLVHIEADPSQSLKHKPLDLPALIRSAWHTLDPLAKQKQLNLVYIGPESSYIQADESRLMQVFLNLFDNSIRYSPAKGMIQAKVEVLPSPETGSQVQVDIIDAGCGFPPEDLPRVFERLYRGEPSRARNLAGKEPSLTAMPANAPSVSTGSGLGLAIVQQIIYAHGGSITAKNHPETGGAWLQLLLPVH